MHACNAMRCDAMWCTGAVAVFNSWAGLVNTLCDACAIQLMTPMAYIPQPCDGFHCACRFEHRPEWLLNGAPLILRDRATGHVSAAGYVLNTPTTPPTHPRAHTAS
jgi:hypothetical protein